MPDNRPTFAALFEPRVKPVVYATRAEAVAEATRISLDPENIFGAGFAWQHFSKWYAANARPRIAMTPAPWAGWGETVCVEFGVEHGAEINQQKVAAE